MIGLIWAQAANGVIGVAGGLPWHLPEDLAHFRDTTRGSSVIMGRRTWESLPARFRPLPGRRNIVLTRQPGWAAGGAEVAPSVESALALVPVGSDVWVIGGAGVLREALPLADRAVRTDLEGAFDGDVRGPELSRDWRLLALDPPSGWHVSRTGLHYRISTWVRDRSATVPTGLAEHRR